LVVLSLLFFFFFFFFFTCLVMYAVRLQSRTQLGSRTKYNQHTNRRQQKETSVHHQH